MLRLMVARCFNFAPDGWWRDGWISCSMAGGAMLGFCARWLAVQCLDFVPDGGAMLGFCAQWLAARCLDFTPDGSKMLGFCA